MHLNAQRSKAMSQFLDGCAPIPPHPAASPPRPVSQGPRGHTQSIVSSSFSVSFTSRYRKISQLSSQSRVELLISAICEVSSGLHAGDMRFRLIES